MSEVRKIGTGRWYERECLRVTDSNREIVGERERASNREILRMMHS